MSMNICVCTRIFIPLLVIGWLGVSPVKASELLDAIRADDAQRTQDALSAGADMNETVALLGRPLHVAVARGSVEIAKLLIDAGADVEAEAVKGQKKAHPLHIAASFNRVAVAALLIERGAKVDSRDSQGRTPLMIAASGGQTEIAGLLLQMGADPLAEESEYHDTPIYEAAMNGHLGVVKLMLSKGVNVNLRNTRTGETPLWVAAMDDRLKVMEFLLSNGADPNIADSKGKTPIQIGVSSPAKDLLRKFGAKE